eukprot:GFUD01029662.1.p1 GENE.GFUD01029662.1~~GFUD01029662.1.p1  ORF type:complete len:198 (-),score=39.28 GFUD01029662.1:48-641(-)
MWPSWVLIVTACSGVTAILKETIHYDEKGAVVKAVVEDVSATSKCWQYTWMGPETEKTNQTGSCLDLETDEGPQRPCFSPIVWTVNDDTGENEPDLNELEEQCDEKGCNPHCTPGPSERCIKYTEWSGKKMSYTAKFCGSVTLDWTGNKASGDRCYRSDGQEYCMCNQDMGDGCNMGHTLSSLGLVVWFAVFIVSYL